MAEAAVQENAKSELDRQIVKDLLIDKTREIREFLRFYFALFSFMMVGHGLLFKQLLSEPNRYGFFASCGLLISLATLAFVVMAKLYRDRLVIDLQELHGALFTKDQALGGSLKGTASILFPVKMSISFVSIFAVPGPFILWLVIGLRGWPQ